MIEIRGCAKTVPQFGTLFGTMGFKGEPNRKYMAGGYICDYCGSSFKRRPDLNKHQKCAKYCLKLRGQVPEKPAEKAKNVYICSVCDQHYTRKDNLKRHQLTCKPTNAHEQDMRIEQLRQEIINLMTLQVKTATNNATNPANVSNRNVVVNNLQPLTEEYIQEHLEHLTLNFIQEGAKGFADFANNYPFKDRVLCTDKSRRKMRYRNEDGEVVNDGGGQKLAQRFFQAIAPRNEELINEEYNAIQKEVQLIAREGRAHTADLTGLLTKATQLQETLRLCKQAAEGSKNELTEGFIKHLTKIL